MRAVLVCKSGGDFNWNHVKKLSRQIKEHSDADIVVLSDVGGHPLKHNWRGWWSKMEIFTIQGPVVYFDLDTIILDDISPLFELAESKEFIALRDPNPRQRELMSSVMAWSGDMSHLYDAFSEAPDEYMSEFSTPRWWGDQGFIERHQENRAYWQDILPGMVRSYKKECQSGVPDGTRVLVFHGKPRPWEAGY